MVSFAGLKLDWKTLLRWVCCERNIVRLVWWTVTWEGKQPAGWSEPDQRTTPISMFACWFQPELTSQGTVFFSHNKLAPAGLISLKTNQRIYWMFVSFCMRLHNSSKQAGRFQITEYIINLLLSVYHHPLTTSFRFQYLRSQLYVRCWLLLIWKLIDLDVFIILARPPQLQSCGKKVHVRGASTHFWAFGWFL